MGNWYYCEVHKDQQSWEFARAGFPARLDEIVVPQLAMSLAANHGSIRMHERLGFVRVATMPEVGRKFGRRLDLVFMQRFLDEPGAPRDD
jgi:hypothetical protein